MNKVAVALATIVIAVGTTACGYGENTPTETVTTTETHTSAPEPAPVGPETETESGDAASEETLVSVVRENVHGLTGTDEDLIALGYSICESFDTGMTFQEIVDVMMASANINAYDSGFIVGASIGAFCPEHESKTEV